MSYDWLISSINAYQRLDEDLFPMNPASSPALELQNPGKGKKRAVCETAVKEDLSRDEEAEEEPHLKKFKNVQKAKSRSVQIPVDENCPLAGTTSLHLGLHLGDSSS